MEVEHPAILLPVVIALGGAFCPALSLPRWPRLGCCLLLVTSLLLLPLLIPAQDRAQRLLMAIIAMSMSAKLFDLHIAAKLGHRPDIRTFLKYLVHPLSLVERRLSRERKRPRQEDIKRLIGGAALAAAAFGAMIFVFDQFSQRQAFAIEHAMKAVLLMLVVYGATVATAAAWRLAGGQTREPNHNFFASRSPAEFWRRYNRLVGQFFSENLFGSLARRSPIVATLGVFTLSGLCTRVHIQHRNRPRAGPPVDLLHGQRLRGGRHDGIEAEGTSSRGMDRRNARI